MRRWVPEYLPQVAYDAETTNRHRIIIWVKLPKMRVWHHDGGTDVVVMKKVKGDESGEQPTCEGYISDSYQPSTLYQ